jgi:hypothetical protein
MKNAGLALILALAVSPAFAQVKPCEDLKSEIAKKLEAKGVKGFQLDLVAADGVKDQTVVGSCEGGKQKITYSKNGGEPATGGAQASPAQPASQPASKTDHGAKTPAKEPAKKPSPSK